ncbi:MAG: outer membrane lipoprotein-sorting protein [Acidobacteria bacterium]|jgi:hypothetical protein|nr:outer membrane lipoprotein-sorting protein [Acidobacteriota bacterium]
MKEMLQLPAPGGTRGRARALAGVLLALALGTGCSIKRTVNVEVPARILAAREAGFDQLLGIVNGYSGIPDLANARMKVTLTYGRWESGEQEEYRRAPGYLLVRNPDTLRLVVQNPITKTAIFDVLSVGDDFSAWVPGKLRFYRGSNSAEDLLLEELPGGIPLRAPHIYEALIPAGIDPGAQGVRVSLEEAADNEAKYYILSLYRDGEGARIHCLRRIWIERSRLAIARQQIFREDGRLISDIEYLGMEPAGGLMLPAEIRLERPEDGYAVKLEFEGDSWRVARGLGDEAFQLSPPPGAEIVTLGNTEKEQRF